MKISRDYLTFAAVFGLATPLSMIPVDLAVLGLAPLATLRAALLTAVMAALVLPPLIVWGRRAYHADGRLTPMFAFVAALFLIAIGPPAALNSVLGEMSPSDWVLLVAIVLGGTSLGVFVLFARATASKRSRP